MSYERRRLEHKAQFTPSGERADQRVTLCTLPVEEPVDEITPTVIRLKAAFRPAPCGCDYIRINGVLQRRKVCDEHRAELGL